MTDVASLVKNSLTSLEFPVGNSPMAFPGTKLRKRQLLQLFIISSVHYFLSEKTLSSKNELARDNDHQKTIQYSFLIHVVAPKVSSDLKSFFIRFKRFFLGSLTTSSFEKKILYLNFRRIWLKIFIKASCLLKTFLISQAFRLFYK